MGSHTNKLLATVKSTQSNIIAEWDSLKKALIGNYQHVFKCICCNHHVLKDTGVSIPICYNCLKTIGRISLKERKLWVK